ncbi:MAG: hypothetical protein LBR77_05220 [Lachnospiraceae bacterium]|jgi:ATP-dependent DNA helicase RecG|nr:hypothetical protein [Lachnospiraceae bacterium]
MYWLGVIKDGKPTLAGLLCFGAYPQAAFPQFCITAVVVPGFELGDRGLEGERFSANKRIEGTVPEMLDEAMLFVERNMREKTIVEYGHRNDKTEYPIGAVREAILNALMHRDYSIHTEGAPIRILMFNDRLEIWNPGGLYGNITIDRLGSVHADTRNQTLAGILEILKVAENRYSGIPTIRKEMSGHHLPAPVFEIRRGIFVVTLKNDYVTHLSEAEAEYSVVGSHIAEEKPKIESASEYAYAAGAHGYEEPIGIAGGRTGLLAYCRIPRSRSEIAGYLGKTQYYAMKTWVEPLLESGRLRMTIPDKPKSRLQKYCSAG